MVKRNKELNAQVISMMEQKQQKSEE